MTRSTIVTGRRATGFLSASRWAKVLAARVAPTVFFDKPHVSLEPERLYLYLRELWERRELEGSIVEVGCYLGGTAATAAGMLRNTGHDKEYVCIDTFGGFVDAQFAADAAVSRRRRWDFSWNSRRTVERLMRHYGCEGVRLLQADVATMPAEVLPERVAVCLIDVDLELPTYAALTRIYPRLVKGGIILVDDCITDGDWPGSRAAYRRFVSERGLHEDYAMGMGLVLN